MSGRGLEEPDDFDLVGGLGLNFPEIFGLERPELTFGLDLPERLFGIFVFVLQTSQVNEVGR